MIQVGDYVWFAGVPIPNCDSCNEQKATNKVYTDTVGIRLCDDCRDILKGLLTKK